MKPNIDDVPLFYQGYVETVIGDDILQILNLHLTELPSFLHFIPQEKAEYRYAADKWTIKDIILHLCDTERIMAYRALRFARNDKKELAGFEQDDYVMMANASNRSMDSLINELMTIRKSTISLFGSFNEEDFKRSGVANGVRLSVNMLGYIIAGHVNHHLNIIKTKYL